MKNKKAKKVMVYCLKGGIGKSTTVITAGKEFAKKGYKVLIVDNDPQANISRTLLGDRIYNDDYTSMRELFVPSVNEETINKAIYNIDDNLDVIGSDMKLCNKEIELQGNMMCDRARVIDKIMKKVEDKYDLILLDFNPYPSLLMTNGIMTSDFVIIPTACEEWSAEGVAGTISLINQIESGFAKKTKYKVFINGYGKTNDDKKFIKDIEEQLNEDEIFKTKIRYQSKPFKDKRVSVVAFNNGDTNVGREWAELLKEFESYIFEN